MNPNFNVAMAGGTLQLDLLGETTSLVTTPIKAEVQKHLDAPELRGVMVDASAVTFMCSSGISLLVWLYKNCQARDLEFALLRPSEQVRKVLGLVQLLQFFPIRETP